MAILTTAEYPAIRAAIDVSLTSKQLPDTIIGLDIYKGRAESEVIRVYSTAETETDPEKISHITNAAVLIAASLLVKSVPFLTRETFGNYQYQRARIDLDVLAANLRAQADDELAQLTSTDITENMPTFFTVAPGYRVSSYGSRVME
jgi:hypothetical protein